MVTVRRDHPGSIGGIFVMYYNPPCVQILLIAPLMQKDKFPRKLATNKTSLVSKYYSSFPKITYLDFMLFSVQIYLLIFIVLFHFLFRHLYMQQFCRILLWIWKLWFVISERPYVLCQWTVKLQWLGL